MKSRLSPIFVAANVPSPALVVTAEKRDVSGAVHRRVFRRDADHRHRPQWAFPGDLPGVDAGRDADLS